LPPRAPRLLQLLDELLAIRRLPVLEEHGLELHAVGRRIVAAVVVHRQMHALGAAIERSGRAGDLLELALAVEVVVLLRDARALALHLREEALKVPAV
jgi:hypothetical protein